MPNGTYGGVRGEKHIKCYPLLDCEHNIRIDKYLLNCLNEKILKFS